MCTNQSPTIEESIFSKSHLKPPQQWWAAVRSDSARKVAEIALQKPLSYRGRRSSIARSSNVATPPPDKRLVFFLWRAFNIFVVKIYRNFSEFVSLFCLFLVFEATRLTFDGRVCRAIVGNYFPFLVSCLYWLVSSSMSSFFYLLTVGGC